MGIGDGSAAVDGVTMGAEGAGNGSAFVKDTNHFILILTTKLFNAGTLCLFWSTSLSMKYASSCKKLWTAAVGDDDGAFIDTEMHRCSKADSSCDYLDIKRCLEIKSAVAAISALPSTYIPHVLTISQ